MSTSDIILIEVADRLGIPFETRDCTEGDKNALKAAIPSIPNKYDANVDGHSDKILDHVAITSIPEPLTLTPDRKREVLTAKNAALLVAKWIETLNTHRDKIHETTKILPHCLCNKIILSGKSYTAEAATVISEFLTSKDTFSPPLSHQITRLDMSDIIASRLEDEGLQVLSIFADVFTSGRLVEINISDNAMGTRGIAACKSMLIGQAGTLEELSLCNNGLSETSMKDIADILTDKFIINNSSTTMAQNLTKLHFFNNMSGNGGCLAFARIMDCCTAKRLVNLRFSSTRAGSEGSLIFVQSLHTLSINGHLSYLQILDLADNTFQDEEAASLLAMTIQGSDLLTYLNVRDCMLGDNGISHICQGFHNASDVLRVSYLDFSANELTKDGASSIAWLLQSTNIGKSIQVLRVEENELTSIGILSIANAIKQNPDNSIEVLGMSSNQCDSLGAQSLIRLMETSSLPNLQSIELDENLFPLHIIQSLTETFGESLGNMDLNDEEEDRDNNLNNVNTNDIAGAVGDLNINF